MRCTRVVIADRYPVIVEGLTSVLGAQRDFKIVAHCGDGASCIKAIRIFVPDIAIVDISMPDVAGLQILAMASSENIPTRLVCFASAIEDRDLRMLIAAGAHAVIPKDVDTDILVHVLRRIADGPRLLRLRSSEQAMVREHSENAEKALTALTHRERQIMRLVSEGLSNKEIGRRLNLTDGTIKVHLHHVFQKLEIGNRTALAALAISKNGNADRSLSNHRIGGSARRRQD